jgi:cellulose synthase/poly-beta-1,6-N-acetylglucosamine synthase-like glycosyltransferase
LQAVSHDPQKQTLPVRQGLAEADRQSTAAARALPVEIGFLAHHGYSPETLQDASILANFAGVSADEFLIKGGHIGEAEFYRALASELALPFTSHPHLSARAHNPNSHLAGLAPTAGPGPGFVIAPCGPSLAQLLRSRSPPSGALTITTPSLLTKAVFKAQARAIAYRAANDLPDQAPDLSSRDGLSPTQIIGLSILALLASFGGFLAPVSALTFLGGILSPLFLGMIVMRLAASILRNPVESTTGFPRADDADLPVYTVIVALYRERRVASRLISALSRLDYPPAKLDIKLVLETDDRETLAALERIVMPGFIEVIVAPPGQPRTKPRALNVALPLARGRFTVIYDAEDVPDPGQLRLSVAAFAHLPRDVACLQARLTIDNTDDSWLTRLFTIEYAALFDVLNPGLAEIGSPIALGGTSNHFRTSILNDICGWDAWNVTEDADLGIRLARLGYRTGDLPSSTLEEAPITLRAWMNQRTRWMKGFIQTCISHSRHPVTTMSQLGPWRFFGALVVMLGTVLSALAYPIFTALFAIVWAQGSLSTSGQAWDAAWYAASLTLFVSGMGAIFIPACVALNRRKLWRLLPWIPLLPLYYSFVSLAAWKGLIELATAPFHWNKTSHGLARTSRAGSIQKHQAKPASTMSLKMEPP